MSVILFEDRIILMKEILGFVLLSTLNHKFRSHIVQGFSFMKTKYFKTLGCHLHSGSALQQIKTKVKYPLELLTSNILLLASNYVICAHK
jgi:hypothetical protein